MDGRVNIRDHGATGDGSDDRTAIQSAIADLPVSGGVLWFPPGVYVSSGPIYIANKSNFVLLGYGATIKIVDKDPCQSIRDDIARLTGEIGDLEATLAATSPPPLPSVRAQAEQRLQADKATRAQRQADLLQCQQDRVHLPYLWNDPNNECPCAYDNTPHADYGTFRYFSNLEIFNCSDWKVLGLTLDGNYFDRGPAPKHNGSVFQHNHGMDISGCHGFTVASVGVKNCQGDAIELNPIKDDDALHPRFPDPKDGTKTMAQQTGSNCSEFVLRDIKVHNVARSAISIVGARNGIIDGLIDYEIGTDYDHSTGGGGSGAGRSCDIGGNSAVHFEVDESEAAYAACEYINVTNVQARNHAITSAALFDLSMKASFISLSNFVYEHDELPTWSASPGAVWIIVAIGSANDIVDDHGERHVRRTHDISLSNGLIHISQEVLEQFLHRDHSNPICTVIIEGQPPELVDSLRSVECWGIDLQRGSGRVTVGGVTIDGPDIGINLDGPDSGFETVPRHIRLTDNIIRNTSHHALWLKGQCSVVGNHLLDVTGRSGDLYLSSQTPAFVHIGYADATAVDGAISFENNVLHYGLLDDHQLPVPVPRRLTYFWLDPGVSRFSADRNKCFGIPGPTLSQPIYHFKVNVNDVEGSDPFSFLQNKLGDDSDGFAGSFRWDPNPHDRAVVPNSNVTRFTQVFLSPGNKEAAELIRCQGVYVEVTEGSSFEVTPATGTAKGTELFGYLLS